MLKRTAVFIWMILIVGTATAATIHIPTDQPNFQAAIDVATDGDTVLVADGTYSDAGNFAIMIQGKAVTIESENGPSGCVIDCHRADRAFMVIGPVSNALIFRGLTIRNGFFDCGG